MAEDRSFIYLNNAATSWPKPPEVLAAVSGEGFFRFEKPDWFSIMGFAGDTTVEVRFKKEVMDLTMDFAYFLFSSFQDEKTDLSGLKQREEAVAGRVRRRLHGE
jgi:hypothetical protein